MYTRKHGSLGDLPQVSVVLPQENVTKVSFRHKKATIIFGKDKGPAEKEHRKKEAGLRDRKRLRQRVTDKVTSMTKAQVLAHPIDWKEVVKVSYGHESSVTFFVA